MGARTKARKRAMDMLFQADVRGDDVTDILQQERLKAAGEPDRAQSWTYASNMVQGVIDHSSEIDDLIQSFSPDWRLERMPAVDKAILRAATWEILYQEDVPTPVAISEAVKLAAEYSTDGSPKFISGVLSNLSATV